MVESLTFCWSAVLFLAMGMEGEVYDGGGDDCMNGSV